MRKLLLGITVALTGLAAQSQVIVSGEITTNTTWTNDNIYLLSGYVYVEDGADLTIEAGTLIKGEKASKGTLIITKTGTIHAQGTACEPIVFTSNEPAGSRTYGDWGGVIILGEAPINPAGGDAIIEGGVDTPEGDAHYGGNLPTDNSGVFSYCRIEFCGIPFLPGNEINGLTMGGVGSGTQIDHIQVSYSGDDSFEWFGGRVNAKYLIAYRGWDDDFDTDFGYRGKVQFCYSLRDPNIADVSGSNGFEADNDATGSTNQPFSKPLFSNVTIAGPKVNTGDVVNSNYKRGAHIRRNTQCSVYNSIIMGYPEAGYKIEGTNTSQNAMNDSLQWKNNILSGHADDYICLTCDGAFNIDTWASGNSNNTYINNSAVGLVDPFNLSNPDPRPSAGSVPTMNGTYFGGLLADPFFTPTTYIGAFSTTDNWTDEPWVNFDCQNTPYNVPGISNYPVITSVVTNMSCANTGAIDVSVSGGNGIYTYAWSDGPTTQDRTGLNAGSYTVTVTSNSCSASQTFAVSDVVISKPSGLSVTNITHCSAQLNWSAVGAAGSYEVRWKLTAGATWSSPLDIGNVLYYTFTGLSSNVGYDFQVRAKCPTGTEKSAWSKKSTTTVTCGKPVSTSVTAIGTSTATINWVDPCSTNNYTLQYRKTGAIAWTTISGITTASRTLTGLLANTEYQYKVRTNCGGGASPYTTVATFTTTVMRSENNIYVDEAILNIQPNPASEVVSITIQANAQVNLTITNMMGQVVYRSNSILTEGLTSFAIDASTFEPGIYLVTIDGENILVSKQLVIAR